MRIAILQRDPLQRQLIEKILEQAGHSCLTYDDGLSMSKALACSTVDLLVLDWNGVRLSGADVLKAVRSVGGDRMPVVFASRDTSEESAVRAFLAGADPDRHGVANFDVGPYHFDGRRQLVTLRGVPVPLSGTQYRLASLFFANIGRVLSRDHIFAMVWGREFREFTRTIDSHVSRLRLLLEIGEENGFRLQPVYKSGYRLLSLHDGAQIKKELPRPRLAVA
jgi:two-component system phosphate regulon response regulator PhoB